ncbi:MAG TPA: hypothetical protein VKA69_03905, partial [Desulfobacteria bacterium]|nr:hypothetical protein [Desulfobacteria bacterium]
MNEILPLAGALTYNSDSGCIYFFNGTTWKNLCNSQEYPLSTVPIVNDFPTLQITESGNQLHLEVDEIRGEQVADFSIGSQDLQDHSVTAEKLDSLSVTDAAINFNELTLNDFQNDAGFVRGDALISHSPNNALTDQEGVFYDDTALSNALSALTAKINADGDVDATNELQQLTLTNGLLGISSGNTVDLTSFSALSEDNQNLTGAYLVGTTLHIDIERGSSTSVDLATLGNGGNTQTAMQVAVMPAGNILSTNVQSALEELQVELDGISAGGASNPNDELQSLQLNNTLISLNPSSAGARAVDLDPVFVTEEELSTLSVDDADADPTNELQRIGSADGSVIITPSGNDFDLSVSGGGSDNQDLTAAVLSGSGLTISIENGSPVTADLSSLATDSELAALAIEDADADPTNELQRIGSADGSVIITPSGNDFDLSVSTNQPGNNLATTDLVQTGGDRIYDLAGQNLSFDGSGSVGIGTDNPQSKLHVSGEVRSAGYANSNGVAGEPSYAFTNDSDTGMWRGANVNYLRFSTDGTEALTINPDQNVGVGVNTPTEKLQVAGNILASGTITPDFVFEAYFNGQSQRNPDYRLWQLEEIQTYI